ncbi:hypothetical protein C4D60_Mb09t26170 [Musa balbisiana]|uniref:Fatty acyl-CoA reductase n=1 Tax=Musa balbisiana TaxID=52838 RepID=A0A4S8IJA6_MUSBA|nr:hypothetical protein C4D60_Mb09t26170 [Musa balbisiana]
MKVFVEKVLRVQPEVKKLFLLVRAGDAESANRRVQTEVQLLLLKGRNLICYHAPVATIVEVAATEEEAPDGSDWDSNEGVKRRTVDERGIRRGSESGGKILDKDLFKVLKDKHGDGFHSFVASKLVPLAGDIVQEDLGMHDSDLRRNLWKEVEVVVNVAATTNFDERYDVALGINVLGAKHILEFAKRCVRLQMLLHVSTAYVAGVQSGLILEKKFLMGETLTGDSYLDIEAELSLADKKKRELRAEDATEEAEKLAMKELGLNRFDRYRRSSS